MSNSPKKYYTPNTSGGCNAQPRMLCFLRKEFTRTILHVHSMPDSLYRQLQQLVAARKRSLSAQIIMLAKAVEEEERRAMQAKALASRLGHLLLSPSLKSEISRRDILKAK